MAIQVLLRRSIEGVGDVGEIVRVKNGYARNFLLPKGYAAIVSPDALQQVEKDRRFEAVRQAEEARRRSDVAERLSALTLTVEAQSGEDGHLYGSVGPRQALEGLAKLGFDLEPRQVRFDPVRELGEYEIPVSLTTEHVVAVKLWVVQDAREAAAAAADAARRLVEEGRETPAGEGTAVG
ncbi:MAG: 50S ribosomal protein L9 [Planctomycetota bacterium]